MARKQKKFGAFSGVFTPSILTILGVIMYMRLGWVTANSGLILTLVIILLAHVISVTTGLSISSIATDKKIRTGGIYYILSRSLGLPIGGAIGLTMFIGTSLSISLYIIGFAENFLGIPAIREFLGLGEGVTDYRIVGTVVVSILLTIALIGTSVAIKTQFFIMAAIGLSLATILAGFLTQTTYPAEPAIVPADNGLPFEVAFAIFFPAVTGFTAGVAMSGDLKDPRKDIPTGTLISIITGLVIYLGLAIGFAFLVDREIMLTDNNFLMKIAWFAPLLIAGIWGATLSSAIGGLLGGPRILQAISRDRITPKIFGKGFGINNEPRNALILTFLIAEAGILIGELDVIAAIVSMFYIAAYGFINLAFALEKWASSDFRPSFRISKWVGIIGFIACFLVMFRIDPTAMLAAILVLWGFYYFIRRKKLELDFGDVWQSVWSSIVRSTLNNITKKGLEERNWRPNIILFSGGTSNRPHLIEFGQDLVVNQGLLSNFDLILNKSAKVLLKKHEQAVPDKITAKYEGIFTRRQECKDIYEGIETIASTYGFSGVEPNTILMGWGRQSQDPLRFAQMIKTLSDIDLNIIMVDYDEEKGFGKYQTIDVWCRGGGNNCSLVMALVRFLWLSERWKDARLRILLINPVNELKDELYVEAWKTLENLRIDAEVKIINNQIEQRPVYEIIQIESSDTDLIFLGITEVLSGEEFSYVETINKLCHNIGTVALVKASSYFKNFEIGYIRESFAKDKHSYLRERGDDVVIRKSKVPEIKYPNQPVPAEMLGSLMEKLKALSDTFQKQALAELFSYHPRILVAIKSICESHFKLIRDEFEEKGDTGNISPEEFYSRFIVNVGRVIEELTPGMISDQRDILKDGVKNYVLATEKTLSYIPEELIKEVYREDLRKLSGEPLSVIWYKLTRSVMFWFRKKPVRYRIRYKRLTEKYIPLRLYEAMTEGLRSWGLISLQFTIKLHKFIRAVADSFMFLEEVSAKKEITAELIDAEEEKLSQLHDQLISLNNSSLMSLSSLLNNKLSYTIQMISNDIMYVDSNKLIVPRGPVERRNEKLRNLIYEVPRYWKANQILNLNTVRLHNMVLKLQMQMRYQYRRLNTGIEKRLREELMTWVNDSYNLINRDKKPGRAIIARANQIIDPGPFKDFWATLEDEFSEAVRESTSQVIVELYLFKESRYEDYKENQFMEGNGEGIPVRALIDHLSVNQFILPLKKQMGEAREAVIAILERLSPVAGFLELPEPVRAGDEDEYNLRKHSILNEIGKITEDLEKATVRIQNHIKERTTAMSDKFTVSSLLRYYRQNRKKIK